MPPAEDPRTPIGLVVGSGLAATAMLHDLAAALHLDPTDATASSAGATTITCLGPVAVLARHGAAGTTPAHLVDHEANLTALRRHGCDRVVALASVGSLRVDWPVGTLVCPDDLFALGATPTVHDTAAGHRVPGFDHGLRAELREAWQRNGSARLLLDGGVYAQTTGPRFETPAEVRFLASVADVVGMTIASECILAGELGLRYATVCQVDNLGNGLAGEILSPEQLLAASQANAATLRHEAAAAIAAMTDAARL